MATKELGYNITLKYGSKTWAGVTSEDFSLSSETKESITKADQGAKSRVVASIGATFSVKGIVSIKELADTTITDRDGMIDLMLAKAAITVIYTSVNGADYTCSAIITGYSESSPSDDNATYSLDLQSTGPITKVI